MSRRAKRIRPLRGLLLAGVALAVVIGSAWTAVAYVRLVRLQVEVADAGLRVEAAARSRAALAVNLIHASETFGCLEASRREALRSATQRARACTLAGDAEDPYREFLSAQAELTTLLDGIWPEVLSAPEPGARAALQDLRTGMLHAGTLVTERLEHLDGRLEAYRADAEHFPGSLISAVMFRDGRSLLRGPIRPVPDARRTAVRKLAG